MPPPPPPQVGDWGRMGSASQTSAARLMERVAGCMKPQFIVSTGDNFYPSEELGQGGRKWRERGEQGGEADPRT